MGYIWLFNYFRDFAFIQFTTKIQRTSCPRALLIVKIVIRSGHSPSASVTNHTRTHVPCECIISLRHMRQFYARRTQFVVSRIYRIHYFYLSRKFNWKWKTTPEKEELIFFANLSNIITEYEKKKTKKLSTNFRQKIFSLTRKKRSYDNKFIVQGIWGQDSIENGSLFFSSILNLFCRVLSEKRSVKCGNDLGPSRFYSASELRVESWITWDTCNEIWVSDVNVFFTSTCRTVSSLGRSKCGTVDDYKSYVWLEDSPVPDMSIHVFGASSIDKRRIYFLLQIYIFNWRHLQAVTDQSKIYTM